jgi:hypothetical protein
MEAAEGAVKVPRFRIAWVMVFVAFVALNFPAIRATSDSAVGGLLTMGALPMANVLAVGILVGLRRPGSRPFLLGFEGFAAMALALYVALACFYGQPDGSSNVYLDLMGSYLGLLFELLEKSIGRHPFAFFPVLCVGMVILLGWPQVVFALIGGFLSRRFKITITRR